MELVPHPPLVPGQKFVVEVYADESRMRSGESGQRIVLRAPVEQKRFKLQVWLVCSADHFVVDQPVGSLLVKRSRIRSSTARFRVRVRREVTDGKGAFLSALFAYQGRCSGRVTRTVELRVPAAADADEQRPQNMPSLAAQAFLSQATAVGVSEAIARPTPSAAELAPAMTPLLEPAEIPDALEVSPGIGADLLIRIATTGRDGRRFTCRVATPLLAGYSAGQQGPWEMAERTDHWVRSVMADFTNSRASAAARRAALKGAGEELFDAAPQVFRDVFWSLIDNPEACSRFRSISIVSDEPFVPWELMIPNRVGRGGEHQERAALGVEFTISRWTARDHVHPPQRLPLVDSYVVAPTDSRLRHAAAEATMVIERIPGELIVPASIEMLDEYLRRGGRSLLHFVCHGWSENGQQTLLLQGREMLRPYFLRGLDNVARAIRENRPLIFLNSCETGRPELGLVGAGGFAETFMNLGAGGVVAALWAVEDDLAHRVADEFYRHVNDNPNTPFASILRDLRRRAYTHGTGDTWAAYCFYGDPLASATRWAGGAEDRAQH